MVDNKDNDEYEFADLDVMSPDSMGEDDTHTRKDNSPEVPREPGKTDVKRNALIVVVLVVIAMLLYKFLGSSFSKKTEPVKPDVPPVTASQPVVQPVIETPKPVLVEQPSPVVTQQAPPPVENPQINQKIASIDLNQQTIRTDVNNLGNQLGSINSTITDLNTKISNLGQMVATLSNTVEQQSIQIAHLVEVRAKKIQTVKRQKMAQYPFYFIQAVIPGRAWLIASNGSTLTVREGTKVAGYGIVKLIDPVQGRVIMNSGRVIRFSQQDS